jgi:hypothetical protein
MNRVISSIISSPGCWNVAYPATPGAHSQVIGGGDRRPERFGPGGGLQAWRSVQTTSFSGKMDAGGNVQLPFVIEMKWPRKTRVEIEFANDKPVQVFDGTKGAENCVRS